MRLTQEQVETLIEHARQQAPRECCGILVGREGKVLHVIPGTNVAEDLHSYRWNQEEQNALFERMLESNLDVLGTYHSHVFDRAYPSNRDVGMADNFYRDTPYVIVSVQDDPEVRAFYLRDGTITPAPIEVVA